MLIHSELINICGVSFQSGNILFHPKKNILYSPIGNRIKVFDLDNNTSHVFPFEARSNINLQAINPDGNIMLIVDNDGRSLIVNCQTECVTNSFNFKSSVNYLAFSPNGKFLAAAIGKVIKIFESPPPHHHIEPLMLLKKFTAIHSDIINTITWTPDSRFIITSSKDLSIRFTNIFSLKNFIPYTFVGQRSKILGTLITKNFKYIYSISKDGHFYVWKWVTDVVSDGYKQNLQYSAFKRGKKVKLNDVEGVDAINNHDEEEKENDTSSEYLSEFEKNFQQGRWILSKRHQIFQANAVIKTHSFQVESNLLIIGYSNGMYALYKINEEELENIQTFSIADHKISTSSINSNGSWLAFASKTKGALFIWEWRSQTFILNQEGLSYNVTQIDFSPESRFLATGGNDGVLRLWDSTTFICFSTFRDHQSAITGVKFTNRNKTSTPIVVSASLDGTVRAYDTARYRNFRIFQADISVQFYCLDIDKSGEIVAAGAFDPYTIYLWSMQTGNIIDAITGHEGPIISLAFSYQNILASGSWDKTVRIHDVFSKKTRNEIYEHESCVTGVAFRPDGKELCVTTMKGEMYLWDLSQDNIKGMIDCARDVKGGRSESQKMTANNLLNNKFFTCITYSADGDYVLACGKTKNICLYELRHRILLKKILITRNRSLDGILQKLNSKNIKDGHNLQEIDMHSDSDMEERKDNSLPGAKRPELNKRNKKLKIEATSIKFSSDGAYWAVATTQGVFVYGTMRKKIYLPNQLKAEITIESLKKAISERDWLTAIIICLRINEFEITSQVINSILFENIDKIVQSLEEDDIKKLLSFLVQFFPLNVNVERNCQWINAIFLYHSKALQKIDLETRSNLRNLLKTIYNKMEIIQKTVNENACLTKYLVDQSGHFNY